MVTVDPDPLEQIIIVEFKARLRQETLELSAPLRAAVQRRPPGSEHQPWRAVRRSNYPKVHGLMSVRPQPSKPPTSRVTTPAPCDRAMAAIIRSRVAIGFPACLRVAKISA